jgi:hypothetical protein
VVSLDAARKRITAIVEGGVARNDFNKPNPEYGGYSVCALAGVRGPRHITFLARTGDQSFELWFGEYDIASDLTIVTYPLFKAVLLAISAVWDPQWSCAQASRNDVVTVPVDFGDVPAFRIDSAVQVPSDPLFPTNFLIPWIAYLPAERSAGVTLAREILTERTPDGGLLMTATTERLDPTDPDHARRARVLADTMIACTGQTPVPPRRQSLSLF